MRLPEHIKEHVLAMPEYRNGAHRVTLILVDGRRIPGVVIAWGDEVVAGQGDERFEPAEVVGVENDST